jgi:hypothetical protein
MYPLLPICLVACLAQAVAADPIIQAYINMEITVDNFRMNTGYGRNGAAYNMVALRCFNDKLPCV